MSRFTLYTYKDLDEYNQRYAELEEEGKQIHCFQSDSTDTLLASHSDVTIDISALVKAVPQNPGAIQNGLYNLRFLNEDSEVILEVGLADQALHYFHDLFDKTMSLYESDDEEDSDDDLIPFERKILYTYENNLQLEGIINFVNENEIPFTNFVRYIGIDNQNFNLLSSEKKEAIVDITSLVNVVIKNPENIFTFEQAMQYLPYYNAIVLEKLADEALKSFSSVFSSKKPISELFEGIELPLDEPITHTEEIIKKVVDPESIKLINKSLSSQLIGHNEFKMRFKDGLDDFLILNELGAEKIFSIFLLGDSGLGKTEVARIIKRTLNDDTPLIKINFGNYSSDNALNSLIGSPRGYIGSEEGELSIKINKSKAGVVLCDEFEKATLPVYNFFLELLEDGVFTDSQSVEYDLNGYIIIFTSNINESQYYEIIPKELQSRFDLVSDFKALTREDKITYVEYQIESFFETLREKGDLPKFSEEDHEYFKGVNIDSTGNLRDIKRMVQRRILDRLKEKLL